MRHGAGLWALLLLFLVALVPSRARAQWPDWMESPWAEGAAVITTVVGLVAVDDEARDFFQRNRSHGSDHLATHSRVLGRPQIYVPVGAGLLGMGIVSWRRPLVGTGLRVSGSILTAGVLTRGLKYAIGRSRPSIGEGNWSFDAFSNRTSFPSGHTAMVFALATALAQEAPHEGVAWTVYGLAVATGWSRLNDDNHWISDVAAGAAVGFYSAKAITWLADRLGPADVDLVPMADGLALTWRRDF